MKNMTRQEYVAHLRRYAEGVVSSACHLNINLTYSHHQYCSSHGHAHHHLNISMDGCRKSSGFSRGASMYRGVTRHHQHGRWQARIGRVSGNKDLYLGTFSMLLNMHGLTLPWFILFIYQCSHGYQLDDLFDHSSYTLSWPAGGHTVSYPLQ
jgi:hypothetical protein